MEFAVKYRDRVGNVLARVTKFRKVTGSDLTAKRLRSVGRVSSVNENILLKGNMKMMVHRGRTEAENRRTYTGGAPCCTLEWIIISGSVGC